MTTIEESPNARLRAARMTTGLSLDKATVRAEDRFPGVKLSRGTLARWETSAPEEAWGSVEIMALAAVYGCTVADLSPVAAERLGDLIAATTPSNEGSTQHYSPAMSDLPECDGVLLDQAA